ncbi:MAG TPA: cupin domain-containing protein [Phycisphaerales bacterium]|nr:cupin domain-containing protein [Phycisphaerales bacterium]HMP38417.1 cupin domain-containing protein [Phycisphaerales bacterium]
MPLEPSEIVRLLGLVEHPTCGLVRETYRSSVRIPPAALPAAYGDPGAAAAPRTAGDAMYFLVTANTPMGLHRIRADQLYHHYLGDPLEVLLLRTGGGAETITVGSDLAAGMRPQLLIPGGTTHVSRIRPGGAWALLATTVFVSVDPSDVEVVDPRVAAARSPEVAAGLRAFGQIDR